MHNSNIDLDGKPSFSLLNYQIFNVTSNHTAKQAVILGYLIITYKSNLYKKQVL